LDFSAENKLPENSYLNEVLILKATQMWLWQCGDWRQEKRAERIAAMTGLA
jgi:hypothetical protein